MSDMLMENAPFGQATVPKLDSFIKALKLAFRGGSVSQQECELFSRMYRVHIAPGNSGGGRGGGRPVGRVLSYWCFCPGVALEDLKQLGVRSVIVTSGTLSPLASFANELRLPFQVQLENPHVIEKEQVWVGILGRGVTNQRLCSTYDNRDTPKYKQELGGTVANLCRIIPGGVLVFFSTYSIMDRCISHWKNQDAGNTWQRISSHKTPMVEPRSTSDLKARRKAKGRD
ncbi:unnamed protein product [Discosporangium mesarthrocarpum]